MIARSGIASRRWAPIVLLVGLLLSLGLPGSVAAAATTTSVSAPAHSYDDATSLRAAARTEGTLGSRISLMARFASTPRSDTRDRGSPSLPVVGPGVATNSALGDLVDVAVDDPAARALAQRLGGRPSVRSQAMRRDESLMSSAICTSVRPSQRIFSSDPRSAIRRRRLSRRQRQQEGRRISISMGLLRLASSRSSRSTRQGTASIRSSTLVRWGSACFS